MVVPVPCRLEMLLKLSTSTSSFITRPAVTGATTTAYGLTSPLSVTVEVSVMWRWIVSRKPRCSSARAAGAAHRAAAASSRARTARRRAPDGRRDGGVISFLRKRSEQDTGAQPEHELVLHARPGHGIGG